MLGYFLRWEYAAVGGGTGYANAFCGTGEFRDSASAMRTLLRKTSNGLFFRGPDQWTENPAEAFNFKSIDHALDFIARWGLREVEVTFGFKNSTTVASVPPDKLGVIY